MDKIIRNHHGVGTLEHEMRVAGNSAVTLFLASRRVENHNLIEKKQKTLFDGTNTESGDSKTIIEHIRTIDDRTYKVTEHFMNGFTTGNKSVETDMTEEEVKQFESDWSSLWEPKINVDELANL